MRYHVDGSPIPETWEEEQELNGHREVESLAEPSTEAGSLADVHEAFTRTLYLPDTAVVDVSLATVVANRAKGDPVWTMLVAPPSSGKTEVLRATAGLPEAYAISTLTAHTFASGMRGDKRASLLHRLDEDHKSLLVLKDFTSVLTMHREARAEILSQLREIYDGAFTKDFGTGQTVAWEGRLGLLAGVTPVVDNHRIVSALLGERFVYLRLPQEDRRALSRRALAMRDHEHEMRERLRQVVSEFLDGVGGIVPQLSEDTTEKVIKLADLTTRLRSGVERDTYSSRDILTMPEPEAPGTVRQADRLARGGADGDRVHRARGAVARRTYRGRLRPTEPVADHAVAVRARGRLHPGRGRRARATHHHDVADPRGPRGVADRRASGWPRWRERGSPVAALRGVQRTMECHPKRHPSHEKPPLTSTNTSQSLPLGDFSGDMGARSVKEGKP